MTTTPAPTDLDLGPIRARLLNATDGPWAIWPDLRPEGLITIGDATGVIPEGEMWTEGPSNTVAHVYTVEDAAAIVEMRNALPTLLDELAEHRASEGIQAGVISQLNRELRAAREELAKTRAELETACLELATVTESADEATRQADGRRDEIDRLRAERGTATTSRTYRDMPVYPCGKVGRGIAHMAHVYGVGEAEVACNGLLFHPVPLASPATTAEPADEPLITVRWPRISGNDIHDLTQAEPADEPKAT